MATSLQRPSPESTAPSTRADHNLTATLIGPVRIAVVWSMATYLLFVLGPWAYPQRYSPTLFVMVSVFNLAMYYGFRRGALHCGKLVRAQEPMRTFRPSRLLEVAFFATLFLFPIQLVIATQNYSLSAGVFLEKVATGLHSAQQNYSERFIVSPPGIWGPLNYVYVAFGFISWLYVPIVVLLWSQASPSRRMLGVLVVIGSVLASVARGQNFLAFEAVAQMAVFMVVRRGTEPRRRAEPGARRVERVRSVLLAVIAGVFLLSFFANTMQSRIGDQFRSLVRLQGVTIPIDESSPLWVLTLPALRPLLASISMYVSHGYAALELATGESFSSTLGLGSSYFLIDNLGAIDPTLASRTYQAKLEASQGYDSHALWHTAYLWIANDVSLWGVPLVLYVFFCVFGRAWRDYILYGNIFGALMMAPMAVFCLFISANNQITGQPNVLIGTTFLTFAWLQTRRRYLWTGAPGRSLGEESA